MKRFKTRFNHKLYLSFGGMLCLLLLVSGVFYDSTRRYQYHLERSAMAHDVLDGFLLISNHTYRKLNAMGEVVTNGNVTDAQERIENAQLLRAALNKVRYGIASELAIDGGAGEEQELQHLARIERLIELIIAASERILLAVENGNQQQATRELSHLRSEQIAGRFNQLIDSALMEERREVEASDLAVHRLGNQISALLPGFMVLAILSALLAAVAFSRGLTRSVNALRDAALAFTSGKLDHRIPALREREFAELGDVFNGMAKELDTRRMAMQQDKQKLETLIDERTSELKFSNARLEQIDKSRKQLLADISHELRTPLTVIRGESDMALRGNDKTSEEYKDALNRVLQQADHTARLVDDLLFVARNDEGTHRIEKRSVAIVNLVRAVCADFHTSAQTKRITIQQHYDDQSVVVLGDAGRLRQVFGILVDNAIRYSHENGTIHVSLYRNGSMIDIAFKDDGIGMTEEEIQQAFYRFYRFYRGPNAKRHAEGSGLGLPVARAIVEAHQGQISLQGKTGEGTEVIVSLPVEDKLQAVA